MQFPISFDSQRKKLLPETSTRPPSLCSYYPDKSHSRSLPSWIFLQSDRYRNPEAGF